MTAGARSLSLEETLLEPPALPPPPMRRVLFVILIALAGLLHVATIGSGDLYSQTEGQYAGAAREMVASLAFAYEQWCAASAKTTVALLADHHFVQALWC
jgi:hypothetical protein